MSEKQLYICILTSDLVLDEGPLKFLTLAVASTTEEARDFAVAEAVKHKPEFASVAPTITIYEVRRSAVERVASELLGWKPDAARPA